VFACQQRFGPAPGARVDGPWIHGTTWDLTSKLAVQGRIVWPARGRELTNADLDACHGRVSEVDWDGTRVSMYRYVLTREYPYTIGCFRGTPVSVLPPGRRGRGASSA
jgi:hypothetical protein